MSRKKELFKNTMILTVGKICTQLITFFLLPIYTSLLSTKEYGYVDLLNTLVSLLLPIVTFQVEQAIFRELLEIRNDDKQKKKVITSGITTVTFQCIIYLFIFGIISNYINMEYKAFMAINVVAAIFSSLLLQISRGLGKNKKFAMGSFLTAFSTICFNIIFIVILKWGANGMLLGTFCGHLVCILYMIFSLQIISLFDIREFGIDIIKKMWKYSIPLIPNAISWWVFNSSDRVIVSSFLGIDQNGILAAATKFSVVYITLYNIFNLSWTEMISLHINDKDIHEFYNKMFNTILNLFIIIASCMIAIMPLMFPVMINEKFSSGYGLIIILLVASVFNVIVGLLSAIYIANKDTKSISITSILSAICNIVVHLLLVKSIGIYAAAVSTLVSYMVLSIYRLFDIRKRYFGIVFEQKFYINSIPLLVFSIILFYIRNIYISIFGTIIIAITALYQNKSSVNSIINLLKFRGKKNGK